MKQRSSIVQLAIHNISSVLLLLVSVANFAFAQEAKSMKPNPVTHTFYITNVDCDQCVAAINESVRKVKSVTDVKLKPGDKYAQISFDTHAVTHHQIAQGIADAKSPHGKPFAVSIRRNVPAYAEGDNAAKVDALFGKAKEFFKVVTLDREKGQFEFQFLPLKVDPTKDGLQGWSGMTTGHALADPPPKGLGLKWQVVIEGQTMQSAKKKK
jgi:copper chaperone CopZ